jgi:hypothetical protein
VLPLSGSRTRGKHRKKISETLLSIFGLEQSDLVIWLAVDVSAAFHGMLSLPGLGFSAEPIEVDARAEAVEIFLDHIHSSSKSNIALPWLWFNTCLEILDLARRFDCTALESRMMRSVDVSDHRPWEYWSLLEEVSKRNNVELGRAILRQLNPSRLIGKSIWSRLDDLDPKWSREIRKAVFHSDAPQCGDPRKQLNLSMVPNKFRTHVHWIEKFDPNLAEEDRYPRARAQALYGLTEKQKTRLDALIDGRFKVL